MYMIFHGEQTMKNKLFSDILKSSLLLAVIVVSLSSCRYFSNEYEKRVSTSDGGYTINPDTIIDALQYNQSDIFTKQTMTPSAESSVSVEPVEWSQEDYYRIAQALHEFVWNDSISNWKINQVLYRMDCENTHNGPQMAHFRLFRIALVRDEETRIVHEISIRPLENSVEWVESEFFPIVEQWESFEWKQFKTTASDAIQIAEENGGYEARYSVDNQCVIFISAPRTQDNDNWRVSYSADRDIEDIFIINIDTFTGEYKIINR
jgi:hypothetical protein